MDIEKKSLIDAITRVSNDIGDILQANEIVETEDIQELCYEALSELYPGGGRKLIVRSKVWKIIQASLNDDNSSVSPKTSTISTLSSSTRLSSPSPSTSDDSNFFIEDIECSPITKPKLVLPSPLITPINDPPSLSSSKSFENVTKPVVLNAPSYIFYSDPSTQTAGLKGNMDKRIRERLIRGTMNNMVSASSAPPFNRFPTPTEIEEMAKSLVLTYPCLKDEDTGHGVVLKALKRRLSNIKPVVKPQGPCPKKRKYIEIANASKDGEVSKMENAKEQCNNDRKMPDNTDMEDDPVDGKEVMERHYLGLQKEMAKKKPNTEVINTYLNMEFTARRDWLRNLPAAERVGKLLKAYPCFKDHVEIIEEARRVLGVESTGDRNVFKNDCLKLLGDEIESVLYYGISKGLCPPKSPKQNSKIMHIFQNLNSIFSSAKKQPKKLMDLIHTLKDHEDPEVWCSKRSGNVPVLVVEKSKCYLITGKIILAEMEATKLNEGVLALLASFYLLDFDYPRFLEIGLNILQHYIFKDIDVPQDIAGSFQSALTSFRKFKAELE